MFASLCNVIFNSHTYHVAVTLTHIYQCNKQEHCLHVTAQLECL